MKIRRKLPAIIGVVVAIALVVTGYLLVRHAHFDVLEPSGTVAVQQRNLLVFTLFLSALVVIPVYTMLGAFAWRYREGNKKAKYSPGFTKNTMLESIWWGIPVLIIGILSVMTWQTSHALDPYKKLASDQKTINVQVVALQWKWLFIYPDYGIATINELPVAEKAPLHFSISADAPMSGFWIPALGTQIYAMNGMNSQLNLEADHTGTFNGYSTNINGAGYADMKFVVNSKTPQAFEAWIKQAKSTKNVLNMDVFNTLTKASIEKQPIVYRLGDKSLYYEVIAMMMNAGSQQNTKTTPKSQHGGNMYMNGMSMPMGKMNE